MIALLVFRFFVLRENKSTKPKPVYHRTWPDEVPGYPASAYVRGL